MVRAVVFLFFLFFSFNTAISQITTKLEVNNDTYRTWPSIKNYNISCDGKYIFYVYGSDEGDATLDIKGTDNNFVNSYVLDKASILQVDFSTDGKRIVFKGKGDSLFVLNLTNKKLSVLPKVSRFKTIINKKGQQIICSSANLVKIFNLELKCIAEYTEVENYLVAPSGSSILLRKSEGLEFRSLLTDFIHFIKVDDVLFEGAKYSPNEANIIYLNIINGVKSINLFDCAKGESYILAKGDDAIPGHEINDEISFSQDGNYVFYFQRKIADFQKEKQLTGNLQIFHYKQNFDSRPMSTQHRFEGCLFAFNLSNRRTTPVAKDLSSDDVLNYGSRYLVLKSNNAVGLGFSSSDSEVSVVDLVSGESKNLNCLFESINGLNLNFSADEKFAVWLNPMDNALYSYEFSTGLKRKLTLDNMLPKDIIPMQGNPIPKSFLGRIASWQENDLSFLISDKFDIWQIDPLNMHRPVCITNGVGRKQQLEFRIADRRMKVFKPNQKIILEALDTRTKDNGFWSLGLVNLSNNNQTNLRKLLMTDHLYSWSGVTGGPNTPLKKAVGSDTYIYARQSAWESWNVYVTKDFKKTKRLSNLFPENSYKWFRSQLIEYVTTRGRSLQGILYKPLDFDSKKKYPAIFTFYQRRSNDLHRFLKPESSATILDVSWYLNNGYLVFVPDIINDEPGLIMENTVSSLESAMENLSKFEWFDKNNVGIQGHSFGGYEVNLAVANLSIFKAAVSVAGMSDNISYSGSSISHGGTGLWFSVLGQTNLGSTPWRNPDVYIRSSPVFRVHKVTTPLLLIHGTKDIPVPFDQAYEFFQALRRESKPVWLLKYDNTDHTIGGPENENFDSILRTQQFFNYYLKNGPYPIWMKNGTTTLGLDLNIN